MKQIARVVLVALLITSALFPVTSQMEYSAPMTDEGLSVLYGGKEAVVDCEALMIYIQSTCYALGAGWLACAIVTAAAYLGCIAANALI
ncbi:MAG: hypothetical protein F9K22_14215 [Bacteroidetes bacterium]|nr:MAG: hypothetical protein F9K22_14215 [Bacteroidota bacterium]